MAPLLITLITGLNIVWPSGPLFPALVPVYSQMLRMLDQSTQIEQSISTTNGNLARRGDMRKIKPLLLSLTYLCLWLLCLSFVWSDSTQHWNTGKWQRHWKWKILHLIGRSAGFSSKILSIRKDLEKIYSLVTTHGSQEQDGVGAYKDGISLSRKRRRKARMKMNRVVLECHTVTGFFLRFRFRPVRVHIRSFCIKIVAAGR